MELLGHDFFIFLNTGTDRLSVVYRRKDGDYGLLEPELG
jgi:putative sigma-54 modulation protein